MTARRVLVPNAEIERVLDLAAERGLTIAGLDVGRDYVRLLPPSPQGDSVAEYIGPSNRKKGAR